MKPLMGVNLWSFVMGVGLAAFSASFGQKMSESAQDMVSQAADNTVEGGSEFAAGIGSHQSDYELAAAVEDLKTEMKAEREQIQELIQGISTLAERVAQIEGKEG